MEDFFQIGIIFDNEIECQEMILRRYHDIEYIMSMEVIDFLLFLQKAYEKEQNEKDYLQWLVQLPHMDKNTYISFLDYSDKIHGRNIDRRSTEEILAEINEIERKMGV